MTHGGRRGRRAIDIQAKTVRVSSSAVIPANGTQRRRRAKRAGSRRVNGDIGNEMPPLGVESALSRLSVSRPVGMRALVKRLQTEGHTLSEHAKAFVLRYLDSCGEHRFQLDSAKVPDGALQTSAVPQARFLDTIELPFQIPGSVDLSGLTYSMLFLQFPLFRSLAFILVNKNDAEWEESVIASFCRVVSSLTSRTEATYPQFFVVPTVTPEPTTWFTIVDVKALRDITPPSEVGVSQTIESFRTTSMGMSIRFNTPALINQGTFAASRYPVNAGKKARHTAEIGDYNPVFWSFTLPAIVGSVVVTRTPADAGTNIPVGPQAIPLTWATDVDLRNISGSFRASVGDSLTLQTFTSAVTPGVSFLRLTNNDAPGNFIDIGVSNGPTALTQQMYYRSIDDEDFESGEVDDTLTVITLPPLTQADIQQANPRSTSGLLKDWSGVYLPSAIFEPVFKVTSSIEYGKIALATRTSTLDDYGSPNSGYFDTVDSNFGLGVINMRSIPYACKFQVKLERTDEIVPADASVISLFATGCPEDECLAIQVAKGLSDLEAHGYPVDYNGLGLLFNKMNAALRLLPKAMGTVSNIGECIAEVSQEVSSMGTQARRIRSMIVN